MVLKPNNTIIKQFEYLSVMKNKDRFKLCYQKAKIICYSDLLWFIFVSSPLKYLNNFWLVYDKDELKVSFIINSGYNRWI